MKFLLISALLASNVAIAKEKNKSVKEATGYIKMLGERLKSELQESMKQDPSGVAAMGFCSASAMKITEEVNSKLPEYANVRRTALKYRNDANSPTGVDEGIMIELEKEIQSKKLTPQSPPKVVRVEGGVRVYKPLFAEAVCLKCHGINISPEIAKIIKDQYPNDKATGFAEGSLRGVIVAEVNKH